MPSLTSLSRYRFAGKNEQAIREEWIRPLLEHLGYSIDTLNDVRYEEYLALRNPRRRVGSQSVIVDYVPTIHGHGLWIVEAKSHEARGSWDDAISQAWLYATHPEIDVPFMAIADGTRIAAYDVTLADWDQPLVDIQAGELLHQFGRLVEVLGAANVAAHVRTRQLRHLGSAMRAELDPIRLDETVDAVRELAHDARSSVIDNRRRVLQDRFERENNDRDDLARSYGVFGIAGLHNQPVPDNLKDAERAAQYVESLPVDLRERELDGFVEAATPNHGSAEADLEDPPAPRMFWMLRIIALATHLRLRKTAGCGPRSEEVARAAIRDHLLKFPDDPIARAAHRLERVLPPFALRMTLSLDEIDIPANASSMMQPFGDEKRLRAGIDGDALLIRTVSIACRRAFAGLDWTEAELNQAAEALERLVPKIGYRTDSARGQAGDPFMQFYLDVDHLVMSTLLLLGREHADLLDEESRAVVEDIAQNDRGSLHAAAAAVLAGGASQK